MHESQLSLQNYTENKRKVNLNELNIFLEYKSYPFSPIVTGKNVTVNSLMNGIRSRKVV